MLRLQDLPRMLNAAIRTPLRLGETGSFLSGWDRRHTQRRTATSMPKTALPHFLVETVDIAAAPGLYFMRSVGSTVAVFFWETPTRPTCKWLGTISVKCTCVTSSRRCVQHAQCRRIADWHSAFLSASKSRTCPPACWSARE